MTLPTPYYDDGKGIVIFHGDCREILPLLEPGSVDLVLTDPPYGHGEKWSGGTWASNPIYERAFDWDAKAADNIEQVIAAGTNVILWGGNYFAVPPSRCWLSWWKTSLMPTMADFELAWTNFDKPSKAYRCGRNPDGKRSHPTQKPLHLIEWCFSQAPDDCETILDPFMGSGTTLVAAKKLGRKCIGIEIEKKYVEIAVERLRQGVLSFAEDA